MGATEAIMNTGTHDTSAPRLRAAFGNSENEAHRTTRHLAAGHWTEELYCFEAIPQLEGNWAYRWESRKTALALHSISIA